MALSLLFVDHEADHANGAEPGQRQAGADAWRFTIPGFRFIGERGIPDKQPNSHAIRAVLRRGAPGVDPARERC